jgi:uncharacterized protein (TIGR00255 family)
VSAEIPPELASMTGFARVAEPGDALVVEIRSVNGRGLDIKLRLPPGLDRLEAVLRPIAERALGRGNVTATISRKREERPGLVVDPVALEAMLRAIEDIRARLPDAPAPCAEAVLALPGVLNREDGVERADPASDRTMERNIVGLFERAVVALDLSRRAEGARLAVILAATLDRIEDLTVRARSLAQGQAERHMARLQSALAALLGGAEPVAPERLAQEIAILAAKSDVTEELDRLEAHGAAARALLAEARAVGRRLDFLVQEFNREANTLCSKSASLPLTALGLELKAAIEQLREQVANVE